MQQIGKFLGAVVLITLGMSLVLVASHAGIPQSRNVAQSSEEAVPAFHAQPPKGNLPETMGPSLFPGPVVENAYAAAAKVKKALYQQPCYCHCDRSQAHSSLLDCFASRHAAECTICIYEGLYTYEQSRKGKTAAQIRAGIIKGDWQSVDISKYQKLLSLE